MRRLWLLLALFVAGCVTPDVVPTEVSRDLAPSGLLRAAINYGNPVLAQRDAATGELRGVSVDLARELARRIGAPLELRPYEAAGKVTADAASERWDIAFMDLHFPSRDQGATAASFRPLFASDAATKPEAFISSTNSRR